MGPQVTMPVSGPASLFIALAKNDRSGAEQVLDQAGFAAAELSRFTVQNQLGGYLHSQLGDLAGHPLFTPELLELLQRRHRWQVEVSERTSGELAELVELFRRHDCRTLLMKGLYLATRFYGGLDQRTFWDIDLLTREADFPRVQQALRQVGFRRESWALLSEGLSRRFVHGFDYKRGRCKVDLHWALVSHPAIRLDYDALWREAPSTEVAGVEVLVLPDDLMIATHLMSAFEDLQRGSLRLRAFVDLYMILRELESTTDWRQFLAERDQEGLRKISISMLSLFMDVFDASDEFPTLADLLVEQPSPAGEVAPPPTTLMTDSTLGIDHKRWAAEQYEMSRARLFGWWLVSLPFRITVYKSDKLARQLRTLGGRLSWWGVVA